jgi:hypothetical protein
MAAKKQQTVAESAALEKQAQDMGIDLSNLDWGRILNFIMIILQALKNPPKNAAASAEHQHLCDLCCQAAEHALESARLSLECCEECSV